MKLTNFDKIYSFERFNLMTNTNQQLIIQEMQNLSDYQQQEVINFIQFLQYKSKNQQLLPEENLTEISAYDLAKDLAGSVDFGPGDLATNKEYLKQMGKK